MIAAPASPPQTLGSISQDYGEHMSHVKYPILKRSLSQYFSLHSLYHVATTCQFAGRMALVSDHYDHHRSTPPSLNQARRKHF